MSFYSKDAPRLLANGYKPLAIRPGTKAPDEKGWRTDPIDAAYVARLSANGKAQYYTGLRTGDIVGLDYDVPDPKLARQCREFAEAFAGEKLLCRIGNAPKFLIPFRTEVPFRKQTTKAFYDTQGRKYQIESLCDGQQFVSYAIHPDTKKPYEWIGDRNPLNTHRGDLYEITQEFIDEIFADFEWRCRKAGLKELKPSGALPNGKLDDTDDLIHNNEPMGLSDAEMRRHLMSIPNDKAFDERNEWLKIIFGVHHERNGDEFSRDLALEWSLPHPSHDQALFDKTWNSAGKHIDPQFRSITFRYIVDLAKKLDQRPKIDVEAGQIPRMADEAEDAILAAGTPIFSRGPQLVRPVIEQVEAAKGRKTKVARLVPIRVAGFIEYLARVADWQRYDIKSKKRKAADPPEKVAKAILEREGEWKLPPIVGVTTTPTIRPDGSILSEPGYDPETRMYLEKSLSMDPIPSKLTRDVALKELKLLEDLIAEWPFVDEASRSVALSMLMTPVLRGAIPVAPLHVVRAPTPGTGKSYLASLASAIATGRICPVIAAGKTEEETEKRLSACLLAGQPIVCIDNVNGELGGDFLAQAIEQRRVQVRILGRSEMVTIETRTTTFATGNNVRVVGDVVRRTLVSTLDTDLERPELRKFQFNPIDRVLADRARYVRAVLVMVLARLQCETPEVLPALGSFEDWNKFVRSTLVWLGRADPVLSQEKSREEDPTLGQLRAFLNAYSEEIGVGSEHGLTASEIVEKVNAVVFDDKAPAALKEVVSAFKGDSRRLGYWLRQNKGRVVRDVRINARNDRNGIAIWFIEKIHGDL